MNDSKPTGPIDLSFEAPDFTTLLEQSTDLIRRSHDIVIRMDEQAKRLRACVDDCDAAWPERPGQQ